jgi:uncharacterized membrane protein required for colicin V production
MSIFDFFLLIILASFVWFGFWFGLIHTFGVLIGIIAGTFVAGLWYDYLAKWTLFIFGGNLNLARVICFIIIFIAINRLVGFVFYLINKIFKFLSIIPFLKTINRLAGAVLGFIEGVLVLGLILYVTLRYPFWTWLNQAIASSKIASYLITIAKILKLLLPEALKRVKDYI